MRYKIDMSKINYLLPFPDENYFRDVVFENNKTVTVVTGEYPMEMMVIDCENKPRDMRVFGIYWTPVTAEMGL